MCELTAGSTFHTFQHISPLQHEWVAGSSQEEGPFESSETQYVLQVLVLQAQLKTDALSQVDDSPWSLLSLRSPPRLVDLDSLVCSQEKVSLVPFLHCTQTEVVVA